MTKYNLSNIIELGHLKGGGYLSSFLESIFLDVYDILDDLRAYWLEHDDYSFNTTAFTKVKDSGDNVMCCCPFHEESNPSFGILKNYPYTSNCFQCGMGWSLPQLFQHVCELSTIAHAEHFIIKEYTVVEEKRPAIKLFEDKDADRKVSHLECELEKYVGKRHPYLYSRGFTERTLSKYEVGYDECSKCMVIPIRTSKGNIRFFKRRSVETRMFLNEKNIYKKDVVFGLYHLLQAFNTVPEIYLTESETDTMACYQGGLLAGALMGKILFKEQLTELLRAGVKKVNLFLDNDYYGLKGAYQAYKLLSVYPIRVNIVMYPGTKFGLDVWSNEEVMYNDANSLLRANKIKELELVPFQFSNYDW